MLQEILDVDPASSEFKLLTNVITAANLLNARTGDLMDLVGFQSGTLSLKPRQIVLVLLLKGIQQRMEPVVRQAGMDLSVDVQEKLPLIKADPERLDQALSNLVENAIKYASEGKRLDLIAYIADNSLVIEVQDYGQGMSLWDRMMFYQPNFLSPHNRSEVPGLGIGLALCRQIVEQHRGAITMHSEKGKGSLFRERIRRVSSVPIVVLAGTKDKAKVTTPLEMGADAHLFKPLSHLELMAKVNAILRRSRASSQGN